MMLSRGTDCRDSNDGCDNYGDVISTIDNGCSRDSSDNSSDDSKNV
jgi:hypothetical protein